MKKKPLLTPTHQYLITFFNYLEIFSCCMNNKLLIRRTFYNTRVQNASQS